MSRSTVLIVGLLSMAVFAILCVRHNVAAIQEDIILRAEQTLADTGAGWADVSVSGRDLSVGGIAPSRAAREQATAALAALHGLRKLTDQIVLSSRSSSLPVTPRGNGDPSAGTPGDRPVTTARARSSDGPYWFSITRTEGGITLEGLMPDSRSREALNTLARRRLGDEALRDLTTVQTGSPPGWRDVTTAALVLSGALVEGEVAVRGRSVFVRGLTGSDASADELRNGLAGALPDGYTGQAEVQPAARLTELLRTAPGAASRLAERRAAARREAAATAPANAEPASDTGDSASDEIRRTTQVAALPEPVAALPRDPAPDTLTAAACQEAFDALLDGDRVQFETASHVIDARSRALLDQLAAAAIRCPSARIEIGGHTDDQGTETNNLRLSQRRAEAVLQYLATRGVDAARLVARGYGESRPLVRNRTAEHRARNRRIELKIIEDD